MKITISRESGTMVVSGDARPVDVSQLVPGVEAVFWDEKRQRGFIQYDEDQTEIIVDRDLIAEQHRNLELLRQNKRISDEPIMRPVTVQKRPKEITSFGEFMPLYEQWQAYVPPSPPPPSSELLAWEAETQEMRAENLGNITVEDLQLMSRANLRAWFDANVSNDAQLKRVVRWMFMLIIRRLS